MRKGERTREMILTHAANEFNRRGLGGTSLDDLMRATGLRKGGLYNHFPSKEALALAAFDHSVDRLRPRFSEALRAADGAVARLDAFVGVFRLTFTDPAVEGGCPVLNAAIDADDTHPELRDRALAIVESWHDLLRRTVRRGVERGELRPDADPDLVASLTVAAVEGAVAVARLSGDVGHFDRVAAHLHATFAALRAVPSSGRMAP